MPISVDALVAGCDRVATRPGARAPIPSLARAAKKVDLYAKATMPSARGLAKDALDDVAYANPLGYLPEIRALLAKGADEHGLALWTARMETIAVYAAARVIEAVPGLVSKRDAETKRERSVRVAADNARIVVGDLSVAGDVRNEGVMIVVGDLHVRGTYTGGDASQLVVLGDVTMGFGFVTGGMGVRGSVDAKRGFVGIGDDHAVYVGGTMRAPLIALMAMSLRAKSRATKLVLDARTCDRRQVSKAKRMLVPQCTASDDDEADFPFDLAAIRARGAKSLPLFRRAASTQKRPSKPRAR